MYPGVRDYDELVAKQRPIEAFRSLREQIRHEIRLEKKQEAREQFKDHRAQNSFASRQQAYAELLSVTLNADELSRLQETKDRRRWQVGDRPINTVQERRDYRNGILQCEKRAYRRKEGGLTQRGPYWYFKWREEGKQRTAYLGKTNTPEVRADDFIGGKEVTNG